MSTPGRRFTAANGRMGAGRAVWLVTLLAGLVFPPWLHAQEIERPGPPALEDFETDVDGDGLPDGWYNPRDVVIAGQGGVVGPSCLRFENTKPGRAARLSRAFGVDGRETEALVIGLWVRVGSIRAGERMGESPGIQVNFLGDGLRTVGRRVLGPWTRSPGGGWIHVAKRVSVPPGTRDALMTVGMMGATGTLEIDGLTIEEVPIGGTSTTNLVHNGDFELGDPEPPAWILEPGARRISPGRRSNAALELSRASGVSGTRALTPLGRIDRYSGLRISVAVRGSGLRGASGTGAQVFFLDDDGYPLPGRSASVQAFRWAGSFDWRTDRVEVPVPPGATRAALQVEKGDSGGTLRIDDVEITSADGFTKPWTPFHVATDTAGWFPLGASDQILSGSALDASPLLKAPAGAQGRVVVKEGRFHFESGGRARFFGVVLLPPLGFPEPERADALADRLAKSGVNLVRFDDFDAPLGPRRSLFNDARDDTKAFDLVALARFDHLVAALKAKGIYIALELQSARRFRPGDEVAGGPELPPGGGPAAAFDPKIRELALEAAKALLGHVNPETGLALCDDPVLAWIVLSGELSLFDLPDDRDQLPPESAAILRELSQKSKQGSGRKFYQATESAQWTALADGLRAFGVKAPIAGCSHWRRDPNEFLAAQGGAGLDLIDDRLYWNPSPWGDPDRRSMLWDPAGAPSKAANRKRRPDRPYVVGQWCARIPLNWALPFEGADLLLQARASAAEDWDAQARRGVFLYPEAWGAGAAGTGADGDLDLFAIPEAINGIPQVFTLLPHASSIALRSSDDAARPAGRRASPASPWEPKRGLLMIDTPQTQGVAGWPDGRRIETADLSITVENPFAVVVASSLGPEPIAEGRRLLVTAVARVEPTALTHADPSRLEVANPGQPPLLLEPLTASVLWKRQGTIKAYRLDNAGRRIAPVELRKDGEGLRLALDGKSATVHWELAVE